MMPGLAIPAVAVLGMILFAIANVDELFVLVGFSAHPKFRTREVVLGQYAGIAALLLVSLGAALAAHVVAGAYVGWLGLIPIAIGLGKIVNLIRGRADKADPLDHKEVAAFGMGNALSVAAVTMVSGAGSIGAYAPLFAMTTPAETATLLAAFAAMTALWCLLAVWLARHRIVGTMIRKIGHRILPLALIALGVLILLRSKAFDHIVG